MTDQCKPMSSPERRETRNVGFVYVAVVYRHLGYDNYGQVIRGSIVEIVAYVSYFDVSAYCEKYSKEPTKFNVEMLNIPLRAGVTYAA